MAYKGIQLLQGRSDTRQSAPVIIQHSYLEPLPATWQCDLSDDSLRWSPGVYDLFGIAHDMRIDRREVVAMYCEESRNLLERLRSHAIANRGSFTFEAQIRRIDGTRRWMRVSADVVCSNGRVTHLYGMKRDITLAMARGEG